MFVAFGNFDGRLGYGNIVTIGDNETPATAGDVNVGGSVIQISAGDTHTCALLDVGNVRCWGAGRVSTSNILAPFNDSGQLGYGNTNSIGDNEAPALAGDVNVGGGVETITTGNGRTCALLVTGTVRCWGDLNGSGGFSFSTTSPLGYGNLDIIGDDEAPASAGDVNIGRLSLQVSTSGSHICSLLTGGTVRCWGNSLSGQLGYGNTLSVGGFEIPTPANVGDVPLF
jgi:alpha-tubulin suppressor-like RCC1 family protein